MSSPSLAPEARGPRLLNLMKEGSPAAKATRHLQPDQLAVPGGDAALIAVLDKRYPKTPDHVNLREVMDELNAFDAYDGESAEALVGRFREAVGRAEAMDYRHSSKARGMMLIDSARLDTAQEAVVRGLAWGSKEFEDLAWALAEAYPETLPSPPA